MTTWIVVPRDPLVVRDGRPNQGRSESATLPFPSPGTVAGVVRTRAGSDAQGRFVAHRDLETLRGIEVRGPLLVSATGERLYVAAPRDALIMDDKGVQRLRALHPLANDSGAIFDRDAPEQIVGLSPSEVIEGKPPLDLPVWWTWASFAEWLSLPRSRDVAAVDALLRGAVRSLPRESRVHVKIDAKGVAEPSMLFETTGLRFVDTRDGSPLSAERELGLMVDVAAPERFSLRTGIGPFAGERRLVSWTRSTTALPEMPEAVRRALGGPEPLVWVRVILLSPAHFASGSAPSLSGDTPLGSRAGVTVRRGACVVSRPETVSGWDFETQKPKKTRRLVPQGSVYWLALEGTPEARLSWAKGVWMQNVSDDPQSRRDGFGLAALGVVDAQG